MLKQIVAQFVFDIAGNANDEPPHGKAENAFAYGEPYDDEGVIAEFFPRDRLFKAIDRIAGHSRSRKKEQVCQQNADETDGNTAPIAKQINLQAVENTPLS